MYAERHDRKAWTVPMLADAKREGRRLVMLTAYDASFARTLDDNGVDLVLVGDSLGMVVQGHNSTLPVVVDDIVYVPLETRLLAAARARGQRYIDGLDMLLHQGRLGFEAWFGQKVAVSPEQRSAVAADLGA